MAGTHEPAPAAIVGIGHTKYVRDSGMTEWELAVGAIQAAMDDAGLEPKDIDGIVRSSYDNVDEAMPVKTFGLRLTYYGEIGYGGLGIPAQTGVAVGAIAGKLANAVICYRSLNGYSGTRYGRADRALGQNDDVIARGDRAPSGAFSGPYGLLSPGQVMATWARRYQYVNKINDEQLRNAFCEIALQQRRYANNNPHAYFHDKVLTREDYFSSRMITDPLCLYDMSLETDGGAAMIIASPEVAARCNHTPAWIRGTMCGFVPYAEAVTIYGEQRNGPSYVSLANELYERAGMTQKDLSAAMLYDANTVTVLLALETYGLTKMGDAWRYLSEVGFGPDSPLPMNTHGGHLSESYVHGVTLGIEAVRQLRGTSFNQVPNATNILCASGPTGYIVSLDR